jgi:hypothetical protein
MLSTSTAITGVGFQPDWVWGKSSSTDWLITINCMMQLEVQLTGFIQTNGSVQAQATVSTGLASFDSDGFTLRNGSH